MLTDEAAAEFIASETILWYQCFNLSENVVTPGVSASPIEWTLDRAGVPEHLDGMSVLDIGTSNGGASFVCEARGADKVVATDLYAPDWFGFDRIKATLDSKVEFVQASLYELPDLLNEQFDIVLFLGVLYHLRHPLLGLDALRELTSGVLYLETAVSGTPSDPSIAEFCRFDSLSGDGSNWFAPTVSCLLDWVASSGFELEKADHWPDDYPTRALAVAHPKAEIPEYMPMSYEIPLSVTRSKRPSPWA